MRTGSRIDDRKIKGPNPELTDFIRSRRRLMVLTGAGCSTESGIPDYRDANGDWKTRQPVVYGEFVGREQARRRYWARSMAGWSYFSSAEPNAAHLALARLEEAGHVGRVVTQNVDGLHQRAGSRDVIDLHGRLDRVTCLDCGHGIRRADFQTRLEAHNPGFDATAVRLAPDGDAELDSDATPVVAVPGCEACGGVVKPTVVFFGEAVPRATVAEAMDTLERSDGLLIVGSSLMVFSGFRFVRRAAEAGIPVAAINLGRTRADAMLGLKIAAHAGATLSAVADELRGQLT